MLWSSNCPEICFSDKASLKLVAVLLFLLLEQHFSIWGHDRFGGHMTLSQGHIADIYIKIHNSSKIIVTN